MIKLTLTCSMKLIHSVFVIIKLLVLQFSVHTFLYDYTSIYLFNQSPVSGLEETFTSIPFEFSDSNNTPHAISHSTPNPTTIRKLTRCFSQEALTTEASNLCDQEGRDERIDGKKFEYYTKGLAQMAYLYSIQGAAVPDDVRKMMESK